MAVDRIARLLDGIERRLGGNTQYLLGKRYRRQGRFAEAISAFEKPEAWLIEERGQDHPYVIAAVVNQAACYADLHKMPEACHHYDRALAMMSRIGEQDHLLARQIREYVATVCG